MNQSYDLKNDDDLKDVLTEIARVPVDIVTNATHCMDLASAVKKGGPFDLKVFYFTANGAVAKYRCDTDGKMYTITINQEG